MRAIILVADEVQDQEFWYPYYRLQEAGFTVEVCTINGPCKGKYGIPIYPTMDVQALVRYPYDPPYKYEIVIIPGGWGCPEKLRMNEDVLSFIKKMNEDNVLIGAICHGPWVLCSADIIKGKKATCYVGMKTDLVNAGAEYIDAAVVTDGNIITSPHYRNNPDFMRAIIDELQRRNS